MKKLATNRHGIRPVQLFKSMTLVSTRRKRNIPVNRHNRGIILSLIDPPGAQASEITTIDDSGVIVGDYIGADGVDHGFIGTPRAGFIETTED